MVKFNKQDKLDIIENGAAWLVVMAMVLYGIGKSVQFHSATPVGTPVSQLSGMELMWAFYGYSKGFVLLLGAFEIASALLLVFKKTRILGCVFLTTILTNVILQDLFYNVNVGALHAAMIYQTAILSILWLNRARLLAAIKVLMNYQKVEVDRKKTIIKLLFTFVVFVVFRVIEYIITH